MVLIFLAALADCNCTTMRALLSDFNAELNAMKRWKLQIEDWRVEYETKRKDQK